MTTPRSLRRSSRAAVLAAALRDAALGNTLLGSAGRLMAAGAVLFGVLAHILPQTAAWAADADVRSQHGDWQIICKRPEGANAEICAVVQDVTSESNPNVGLGVRFQTAANGEKVLRVFAPLGILLTRQLRLQIDDATIGHAPFIRCGVYGCMAQVNLTPDIIEKLTNGRTAWFVVFQTEEAGVGIPVSLTGFAEAFAELK